MKLLSERRAVESIATMRDPRMNETWFRKLPPERREQMTAELREQKLRGLELEREERTRALQESLGMGAIFALGSYFCPGGTLLGGFASGLLGTGLGFGCNRLDAHRLMTSAAGMFVFLGSQVVLLGGLSMVHFVVSFLLGALCALIGYHREERGT